MKQTLTKDQFRFQMNQIRPDNFSYEGQGELFDYLEMLEESTGTEIEFDPIALCCEYCEMTINEVIDAYNIDIDYDQNIYMQVMDYISANSEVVGDTSNGTVVFQQF